MSIFLLYTLLVLISSGLLSFFILIFLFFIKINTSNIKNILYVFILIGFSSFGFMFSNVYQGDIKIYKKSNLNNISFYENILGNNKSFLIEFQLLCDNKINKYIVRGNINEQGFNKKLFAVDGPKTSSKIKDFSLGNYVINRVVFDAGSDYAGTFNSNDNTINITNEYFTCKGWNNN